MHIKEDFKEIREATHMMSEQLHILKDMVNNNATETLGLDIRVVRALDRTSYDKIPLMDEADTMRFLRDNGEDDANIKALKNNQEEADDEWKNKPFDEYCRFVLSSVKDSLMEIRKMEKERDSLTQKMESMEEDYFGYVNTPEYKEKNRQRRQEMREQAENEEDAGKKASIIRDLDYMENAETLQFIMERVEQNGQKEVDNIASTFFDHTRSTHIMKKFAVRMPRFGYNKDIYKFFFNLEENFLPEEYHVFNNLFLFHVMRLISYMDANIKRDHLYVSSILVKIYNLIYHKFATQEQENEFVDMIKKFDDLFRDKWFEKFQNDNVTQPKHPDRIAMEEKADEKRRIKTIAELQNHGVDPDTTLDTNTLVEQLKQVIENEKAQRDAELEKWTAEHPDENESSESQDSETDTSSNSNDSIETAVDETEVEVIEQEPVIDMENAEEVLDAINASKEFDKFDEDISNMGDELRQEMNRDNADGIVATEDALKENNLSEVEVYVDIHGYYYRKMEDGTYTYFSNKDTVYETGISEETILQLINTGNLQKIKRYL